MTVCSNRVPSCLKLQDTDYMNNELQSELKKYFTVPDVLGDG